MWQKHGIGSSLYCFASFCPENPNIPTTIFIIGHCPNLKGHSSLSLESVKYVLQGKYALCCTTPLTKDLVTTQTHTQQGIGQWFVVHQLMGLCHQFTDN